MLQFHGSIGNGKFGVMNDQQVKDMLLRKYPYLPSGEFKSALTTCIASVQKDAGTATGDYKYDGLTIYHTSMGAGQNKGCTLFYVRRPGDVAKVVAIGYHVGAQTYQMEWVEGHWFKKGGRLTLDKK